jgi:hypothetical protein
MSKTIIASGIILLALCSICIAEGCQTKQNKCKVLPKEKEIVEKVVEESCTETRGQLKQILKRLGEKTDKMKAFQSKIHYLFIQDPELIDSRTIRTGRLYYKKDKSGARIRVNFETSKQDEADTEKYQEHYIFDGIWLTKVDYHLEKVDFYQQAPEDKPVDVFKRISQNFPLIGFSKADDMEKQFEMALVSEGTNCDPNEPIHLRLEVKKNSDYKDDYKVIDFYLDKATFLPVHVVAVSTEDDIYDIVLLDLSINKNLENSVFKVETPAHFDKNRHPLKQKP